MTRRNAMRAGAVGMGAVAVGATGPAIGQENDNHDGGSWFERGVILNTNYNPKWVAGQIWVEHTTRALDHYLSFGYDDDLDDFVGADALRNEMRYRAYTSWPRIYRAFEDMRQRVDESTHIAFAQAKVAMIEAINDGEDDTEELQEIGHQEVHEFYADRMLKNMVFQWNEWLDEFNSMLEILDDHGDTHPDDLLSDNYVDWSDWQVGGTTEELRSGETIEVRTFQGEHPFHDIGEDDVGDIDNMGIQRPDSSEIEHIMRVDSLNKWTLRIDGEANADTDSVAINELDDSGALWDDVQSAMDDLESNVNAWINNHLSEIEDAEIDLGDVMDPSTFVMEYAADEDSHHALATADLLALGYHLDLEDEATEVELQESGWNLEGMIGLHPEADSDEQGLSVGEVYDPDEDFSGPVMFAFDPSTGFREVPESEYNTTLDGTELTITDEPWGGTVFEGETTADDSAFSFTTDDLEPDDEDFPSEWTVDIEDHAENPENIVDDAEVEEISQYGPDVAGQIMEITEDFEVTSTVDEDGESRDELNFTQPNYQTSDNYITQDEWDSYADSTSEYDEYEESGGLFPGLGDIGVPGIAAALIIVGAIIALFGD